MKNLTFRIAAIVMTHVSALFAQDASETPKRMAADASPQFEVAAIKPGLQSRETGGTLRVSPGGLVNLTNFPVMTLIQFSYNVPRRQISGGPSWLESERFDVAAKSDQAGQPDISQVRVMLRKLLEDRLQLTVHRGQKELPVYALTVAKDGPKIAETGNPNGIPSFFGRGEREGRNVKNATMGEFASDLQGGAVDRPVVDRTGLGSRRYDFILKWTPPDAPAMNGGTDAPSGDNLDAPPDIFTAIQQQLGLKLESTKAQVDVIVVDHIEKPSEN